MPADFNVYTRFFFFFFFQGKQKWFMKQNTEESAIGRKLSDHKLNNTPDADWLQLKPLAGRQQF